MSAADASVGLVGGLGPESTIDYYRRILELWAARAPVTAPGIVIDSLDVQYALRLLDTDRAALAEYLLASVRRLAAAGVRFVAISANTPHIVFDEVEERAPLPLLSIVECCAAEAARRGFARPLLLGTRFTMEGRFYPETFARFGLAVETPDAADREWVHARYMGELLKGEFRDETRDGVVALVERLRDERHADALVLAGTELPLLLGAPVVAGLSVLDTTELHVRAIVDRLTNEAQNTDDEAPNAMR